jgi:anti-anti-sigma factor
VDEDPTSTVSGVASPEVPSRSDGRRVRDPDPGLRHFPEPTQGVCTMTGTLSFTVSRTTGSTVIAVAGEIDGATAPELDTALQHFEQEFVTVDLSGVTFIDSSGLGTLVQAHQRISLAGGRLTVSGSRPNVQKTFEITHLADTFRADQTAI